jgi:hypothetical protein
MADFPKPCMDAIDKGNNFKTLLKRGNSYCWNAPAAAFDPADHKGHQHNAH